MCHHKSLAGAEQMYYISIIFLRPQKRRKFKLLSFIHEMNIIPSSQYSLMSVCSGTKYYRYTNKSLDQGFPKRIKQGFPGIPPYLDAALLSQNRTQILFLKNNKYWMFSPSHKPPLLGRSTQIQYVDLYKIK